MGTENLEQASEVPLEIKFPQNEEAIKEQQERADRVNKKISDILREENCTLMPVLNVMGNQIQHVVQVFANKSNLTI